MAYYRVRTGNRESIVKYDQPMSYVGEIYKDRLVGECDEYGNLRNIYISPALEAALAKAGEELRRKHWPWPMRIDEFTQILECLPSSQVRWSDIKPLPEFYPGLKRELTTEGDVVETPITPEESVVTTPSFIETILTKAVITIPLRNLTDFGATESVNYLFDKLTPQEFGNLQYAKWIIDHGNSTTLDLLEALQTTTPLPLEKAHPLSDAEHARLMAYIDKINSTLMARGIDPHYVSTPEAWQAQKAPDLENMSAFDLIKQNQPSLTHEQYLADCFGHGSVAMDPNEPNPLKLVLDSEQELKVLRSMIITALDTFKDNVDQSYGCYDHLGEARNTLMSKQFKHVRRYAKQLVRRLTAPGDTFEQVFLDTAEADHFGFLTRDFITDQWTRHFTIKFVDENWLIVEY